MATRSMVLVLLATLATACSGTSAEKANVETTATLQPTLTIEVTEAPSPTPTLEPVEGATNTVFHESSKKWISINDEGEIIAFRLDDNWELADLAPF